MEFQCCIFGSDKQEIRSLVQESWGIPDVMLMNGKAPYGYSNSTDYESFTVTKGKKKWFLCS